MTTQPSVAGGAAAAHAAPAPRFHALSTIGSGSLVSAYKAIRAMEMKGASGAHQPDLVSDSLRLAERARSGDVVRDLSNGAPVIGSAVGLPGAFAAYGEQMD